MIPKTFYFRYERKHFFFYVNVDLKSDQNRVCLFWFKLKSVSSLAVYITC